MPSYLTPSGNQCKSKAPNGSADHVASGGTQPRRELWPLLIKSGTHLRPKHAGPFANNSSNPRHLHSVSGQPVEAEVGVSTDDPPPHQLEQPVPPSSRESFPCTEPASCPTSTGGAEAITPNRNSASSPQSVLEELTPATLPHNRSAPEREGVASCHAERQPTLHLPKTSPVSPGPF